MDAGGPRSPIEGGWRARWRRRWRSRRVIVRDHSMEPTFRPGDRLLVDPQAYRDRAPARGDLVVVADPANPERWLLKRVIGTPGDAIRVDRDGAYRTQAHPVDDGTGGGALEEMEVPADHVFLLSDRPAHTRDSRQFGPVPVRAVVGRVYRRTGPAGRAADL